MNASQLDSGNYTIKYRSDPEIITSEASTDLLVIVPPTNQCIPHINHEGDSLVAKLPQEGCGIPKLTVKWKNGTQKSDNGSILSFESGLVPGIYIACAYGESIQCFQEKDDKLCSNYTVSAQPQNESSSVTVMGILGVIISICIVIGAVLSVFLNWKSIKRKLFSETNETGCNPGEDIALMEKKTLAEGIKMTDENILTGGFGEDDEELSFQENSQQEQQAHGIPHLGSQQDKLLDTVHESAKNIGSLGAKFPQYNTYVSRLNTFEQWPQDSHMQPKKLAEVGFFYQGNGDQVICFFCAGVLDKWAPEDEAWAEHEKHYPLCEHVKSHKMGGSSLDETEGHQGIQSGENLVQEERCISSERDEMREDLQRLQDDTILCKICRKENACIVFSPCSHFAACSACAESLHKCSVCGERIQATVKAFCKSITVLLLDDKTNIK